MHKLLKFLTASILAGACLFCRAQDNLEPGHGHSNIIFTPYNEAVQDVMSVTYKDGILLRLQVYPSFSPEWIVGLSREGNAYKLFYAVPQK